MKTNKLLAGLLALAIASPALAIDDFSRGAVVGVAGAWLFNKFNNMPQQQQYPQQRGIYMPPQVMSVPPMQPQANYVYTCYVQVQDPYTGAVQLQQQVCLGR